MHSNSSGNSSPSDGRGEENTPIIPKRNVHLDQIVEIDPIRRTSVLRRESFVEAFVSSNGPPQIMILMLLLALGLGSTIGVVSQVTVLMEKENNGICFKASHTGRMILS